MLIKEIKVMNSNESLKTFHYSIIIRVVMIFLNIIFVFSIMYTIIKYPLNYWFQIWFLVPIIIFIYLFFGTLNLLIMRIVINKEFIKLKSLFKNKKILFNNVVRVIKPFSGENNKTKNFIFVMKDEKEEKIQISYYWGKSVELYFILASLSDEINKS